MTTTLLVWSVKYVTVNCGLALLRLIRIHLLKHKQDCRYWSTYTFRNKKNITDGGRDEPFAIYIPEDPSKLTKSSLLAKSNIHTNLSSVRFSGTKNTRHLWRYFRLAFKILAT